MDNGYLFIAVLFLIVALAAMYRYRERFGFSVKGPGFEANIQGEGGKDTPAPVAAQLEGTGTEVKPGTVTQTMTGSPSGQQVAGNANFTINSGNVTAGRDATVERRSDEDA